MMRKLLERTFRVGMTLVACVVALLVAGCATSATSGATAVPAELWLKEENNGQRVEVRTGQMLGIDLESIPGTGYSWQVKSVDEKILQQQGEPEFKNDTSANRVGGPSRQLMRFKIGGKGETKLELVYVRPWEKDQPPEKTWTVTVVVQ